MLNNKTKKQYIQFMNDTFIVKTCDLMVSHPIQIEKAKIPEIKS